MEKRTSWILTIADKLPIMSTTAMDFMNLAKDPDASVEEMARIISRDQVLAVRVLKLANSPFYGHAGRVRSLLKALMMVGLNATKSIVMTSVMRDLLRSSDEFEQSLWRHSTASALTAKATANAVNYRYPEDAFVAGLIRDIGLLVLYRVTPRVIKEICKKGGASTLEEENAVFGINHCQLGMEICRRWNFPEEIVQVLAHEVGAAGSASLLALIVHVAARICGTLGISLIHLPDLDAAQLVSARELGLTELAIKSISDEIASTFEGGKDYFLFA
jgi:HD-like signal output (HDOD) protein